MNRSSKPYSLRGSANCVFVNDLSVFFGLALIFHAQCIFSRLGLVLQQVKRKIKP